VWLVGLKIGKYEVRSWFKVQCCFSNHQQLPLTRSSFSRFRFCCFRLPAVNVGRVVSFAKFNKSLFFAKVANMHWQAWTHQWNTMCPFGALLARTFLRKCTEVSRHVSAQSLNWFILFRLLLVKSGAWCVTNSGVVLFERRIRFCISHS